MFIEVIRYAALALTLYLHPKDILHNSCSICIHYQLVPVLFVLQVAIWCECPGVLPILTLCLQIASDLNGNIPAIKRHHDIILVALFPVYIVIDSDKSYTQCRENTLDIFAGINILTTETTEILYDHTVDHSTPHIINHIPKSGTVKITACKTIVLVLSYDLNVRFILYKISDEKFLILDAVALCFERADIRILL